MCDESDGRSDEERMAGHEGRFPCAVVVARQGEHGLGPGSGRVERVRSLVDGTRHGRTINNLSESIHSSASLFLPRLRPLAENTLVSLPYQIVFAPRFVE
jgi:hypothetical protein